MVVKKMRQISVMLQLWFVVTEPLTVKKWPHRLDMRSFSEGSTCLNLWRRSQLCKSHHHMKATWTFGKNLPLRWRMFVSEEQYPVMTRHNWMEWFPTKDETLVNLPQTRKLCSRLWVVNVIWLGKRKRVLRLFLRFHQRWSSEYVIHINWLSRNCPKFLKCCWPLTIVEFHFPARCDQKLLILYSLILKRRVDCWPQFPKNMQRNVYRDPKWRWVSTLEVIGKHWKIDVTEDVWIIGNKMSKEITGISDFEVFDPKILSQRWFLSTNSNSLVAFVYETHGIEHVLHHLAI